MCRGNRVFLLGLATSLLGWILLAGILAGSASADQTDPKLDELFSALKTTPSKESAAQIQQEIWQRWTAFDADEKINTQMQVGVQMMNTGALQRAEKWFGEMTETVPDFAEVWNKRATVRFMIGNFAGSKSDIARVLQLEPRHFGALSGLGMIHMHEENLQGALLAYRAADEQNPHMDQVKTMIIALQNKLKGEPL